MNHPLISVVIGHYNQHECLSKVLDGFEKQSLPADQFEVIVVDSSSTDGSQALFSNRRTSYPFKFIVQENNGKTGARNRGAKESSAELLFITDADMVPHEECLERHIKAHQTRTLPSSFEGLTYNLKTLSWPINESELSPYIRSNYSSGRRLGWSYFLTGNVSLPKSLFEEQGGFDEDFQGYGWEDIELGYRLFNQNIPLYYLKEAINYHYHVVTPDEEIKRNVDKGRSAKLLLKKHKELKWYLGLNPVAIFIFKQIKSDGGLYRLMARFYASSTPIKHKIGFWFLKEYYYLSGILE